MRIEQRIPIAKTVLRLLQEPHRLWPPTDTWETLTSEERDALLVLVERMVHAYDDQSEPGGGH